MKKLLLGLTALFTLSGMQLYAMEFESSEMNQIDCQDLDQTRGTVKFSKDMLAKYGSKFSVQGCADIVVHYTDEIDERSASILVQWELATANAMVQEITKKSSFALGVVTSENIFTVSTPLALLCNSAGNSWTQTVKYYVPKGRDFFVEAKAPVVRLNGTVQSAFFTVGDAARAITLKLQAREAIDVFYGSN